MDRLNNTKCLSLYVYIHIYILNQKTGNHVTEIGQTATLFKEVLMTFFPAGHLFGHVMPCILTKDLF